MERRNEGGGNLDEAVLPDGVDSDDEVCLELAQREARSDAAVRIPWIEHTAVLVLDGLEGKGQRRVGAELGNAEELHALLAHRVLHQKRGHLRGWLGGFGLSSLFQFFWC
jgi:hypothetical protein